MQHCVLLPFLAALKAEIGVGNMTMTCGWLGKVFRLEAMVPLAAREALVVQEGVPGALQAGQPQQSPFKKGRTSRNSSTQAIADEVVPRKKAKMAREGTSGAKMADG